MVGAEGPGLPVFLHPNRMKGADLRTDAIIVSIKVAGSDFNSPARNKAAIAPVFGDGRLLPLDGMTAAFGAKALKTQE
jgi:hypothetical protein